MSTLHLALCQLEIHHLGNLCITQVISTPQQQIYKSVQNASSVNQSALGTLFLNNVFTLKNLSYMSLHAISVFDKV